MVDHCPITDLYSSEQVSFCLNPDIILVQFKNMFLTYIFLIFIDFEFFIKILYFLWEYSQKTIIIVYILVQFISTPSWTIDSVFLMHRNILWKYYMAFIGQINNSITNTQRGEELAELCR